VKSTKPSHLQVFDPCLEDFIEMLFKLWRASVQVWAHGTWKRLERPIIAACHQNMGSFPINGGFSMPGGERHSLFAQRGALRREHRRGL
jgi:hypothetical protein